MGMDRAQAEQLLVDQTAKAGRRRRTKAPAAGGRPQSRPADGWVHKHATVWAEFAVPELPGSRTNGRRHHWSEAKIKAAEKVLMLTAWASAGRPMPDLADGAAVEVQWSLVRPSAACDDDDNGPTRLKILQDTLCKQWGVDDGDRRRYRCRPLEQVRVQGCDPHVRVRFRVLTHIAQP